MTTLLLTGEGPRTSVIDDCVLALSRGTLVTGLVRGSPPTGNIATSIDLPQLIIEPAPVCSAPESGNAISTLMEPRLEALHEQETLKRVLAFAQAHNVTKVWAVLNGRSVLRLALAISRNTQLELYSHITSWPPAWICADAMGRAKVLREYADVITASKSCATGSPSLSSFLCSTMQVRCDTFVSSKDALLLRGSAPGPRGSGEVVIGVMHSSGAQDALASLLASLGKANWSIDGRRVRLFRPGNANLDNWSGEEIFCRVGFDDRELVAALASFSDVIYYPGGFAEDAVGHERFQLFENLPVLLAAGRPVLCHAPLHAATARYFNQSHAGMVCPVAEGEPVLNYIKWLMNDQHAYARLARGARDAFMHDFEKSRVQARFRNFLNQPDQKDSCAGNFGEPSSLKPLEMALS